MVNQRVLVRDKWRWLKKVLFVFLIVAVIILILGAMFFFGFFSKKAGNEIVIENPLKDIVFANTDPVTGEVNRQAVVEQGIIEFNEEYINYLLVALGVGNLYKSMVGYGNPIVEFIIDEEVWSSELGGGLNTVKAESSDEDLRIHISRKEAVEALLSPDIEGFMKQSVSNGNTRIEMVAGKVELASKGYLAMYKELTGEEVEGE